MGNKKYSLSTIFVVIAIIMIVVMGITIYKQNIELNKHLEPKSNVKQTEKEINNKEYVELNSEYGQKISSFLENIWIYPEEYEDCIAEFSDLKSAPKDYLAACAAVRTRNKIGIDYYATVKFSDFNTSLIELFGNKADGLITASDIESLSFIETVTENDTYSFIGHGGSETFDIKRIINKIEKQNNIFIVTQYEYEEKLDHMLLDFEEGDSTQRHIYDRSNNLILNTTIKALSKNNSIILKEYDENGNEIDSIQHLLLTKYINKLSVREIKLEYNYSDLYNSSLIMISNRLKK